MPIKKSMTVWFREFKDQSNVEIGLLENKDYCSIMDTKDFAYVYNGRDLFALPGWTRTPEEMGWIYIGEFD